MLKWITSRSSNLPSTWTTQVKDQYSTKRNSVQSCNFRKPKWKPASKPSENLSQRTKSSPHLKNKKSTSMISVFPMTSLVSNPYLKRAETSTLSDSHPLSLSTPHLESTKVWKFLNESSHSRTHTGSNASSALAMKSSIWQPRNWRWRKRVTALNSQLLKAKSKSLFSQ